MPQPTLPAATADQVPATTRTASASATATAVPATATATLPLHGVTVTGRIHADLPPVRFTLLTDGSPTSEGVLRISAIEIRHGNASAVAQRIAGLRTETPVIAGSPPLELLDMNFDGYTDVRLIESRPAGPNLPYLNWLYDPASGKFVESAALNAITAPRFDADKRELRSEWRDGANIYGTDVHGFRDGKLLPLRREAKFYQRAGVFTLQLSHWIDGAWRVVETRAGHDP